MIDLNTSRELDVMRESGAWWPTSNEVCQRLTEAILVLTERLEARMRERGYDDWASEEIEPVRSGSLTFLEATSENGFD